MVNRSGVSFASRVERLLDRVTYERIDTASGLDAIDHLRYEAYLKEGAIEPNGDKRLVDAFDRLDNTHVFGVYIDGELASAVRLHLLSNSRQNSPALETFPDALLPLLRAGETILDPNRFVAHPEMARLYPELPFVTLRAAYMASAHFQPDKVTATCRTEHQAFYVRHMFASLVRKPRPYPTLLKPLGLMLIDFAKDHQRILDRNPYWQSSASERQAMFGTAKAGQLSVACSNVANAVPRPRETEDTSVPTARWLAVGQ